MDDTLDLLTQLGAFHSQRKDKNSKVRFLSTIQEYLKAYDIHSDIYKFKDRKKSLMLVVGDLDSSKTVYMTHFDTPKWTPKKVYKPGDLKMLKRENIISIFISILIFLIISVPFLFFSSRIWTDGVWNYKDFVLIFYMLLLFLYIRRNKSGFYRKDTLIRNTSSVVALIEFIKRNPQKNIVLVDYGCEDLLGYYLFKEQYSNKEIIYLDSVGYGEAEKNLIDTNTVLFSPSKVSYKKTNVDIEKNISTTVLSLEKDV